MTLSLTPTRRQETSAILEITADVISQLPIGFWSHVTHDDVRKAVERYPGRSVWRPDSLEFAVAAPWRNRSEIAAVIELSAVRHPAELLTAVAERCERHGAVAAIGVELDEVRTPAFYERAGFELLEEVVTYSVDCEDVLSVPGPGLDFRIADLTSRDDLDVLVRLDREAFPWLWWNCEAEFRSYREAAGVEVFIGHLEHSPVSYVGLTTYLGWGHLDRIAVARNAQGSGLGRAALTFATRRLIDGGARRIGLSTQFRNERSRRLYEGFGFRRAAQHDYRIYGRVFRLPEHVASLILPVEGENKRHRVST